MKILMYILYQFNMLLREGSLFTGWGGGSQRNSLYLSRITLFTALFYTTYYLAPKESKNINGPISFAPLMMRPISFAPLTTRPLFFVPPYTRKKCPKTLKTLTGRPIWHAPPLRKSSNLARPLHGLSNLAHPPVRCRPHHINNEPFLISVITI